MKKLTLLSALFILLLSRLASGQSEYCNGSTPFCLDQPVTFEAETTGTAEPGAYYGCLATQVAPSWFHMRILDPGNITIYLFSTPSADIDFICWGPFTDPYEPCVTGLTSNKVIDCSYSPSPTELCEIPNGQAGQYYILMVTNFSQQPAYITFSQWAGTGSLECSPVTAPDLAVINPGMSPDTLFVGDSLTVSCTVTNQGIADAPSSGTSYYISSDTTFSLDDFPLGADYNGILEVGDSIAQDFSTVIPQGYFPGSYYILFYVDAGQNITESDEENNVNHIGFMIDTTTAIPDPGIISNYNNLKLYPNPARDRLYIDYSGQKDMLPEEIALFNSTGTRMNISVSSSSSQPGHSRLSLSLNSLPPGCYLLRMAVAGEVICKKVMVVH